ncbi:MAG: DUF3488 and transglutaminase-like domain-containing protein [Chloroflexota bacterium]|nr:DUF3488 and transglutaminase-like domain-containing protein [Chloroflexota bacterium]
MRARFTLGRIVASVLLLIIMTSLARSIEMARWTQGLHVLATVAVFGVLVGVVLASSQLGALRAHLLGAASGLFIVMWQTGRVLAPTELEGSRLTTVWSRLREWVSVIASGGTSYDELLFVFTMGAIVWFLAYNSSWFVIRYNWAWWAVLPTGLVMLVNLGYTQHQDYEPFVIFLLSALLLMVQSQLMRSSARWQERGLSHDRSLGAKFFMLGGLVSVLLLIFAWQAPSRSLALSAKAAWRHVEKPWEQVQDRWQSAFGFLYPHAAKSPVTALGGGFTSFSDSFELGGPLRMGNRKLFSATGDSGQYWKSVSYDTYTGREWSTSSGPVGRAGENTYVGTALRERQVRGKLPPGVAEVKQTVRVYIPVGRSMFAADTPVSVVRAAEWQLGTTRRSAQVPVRGRLTERQLAMRGDELTSLRTALQELGPENIRRASAEEVVLVSPDRLNARATPAPATGSRRPQATAGPQAEQTAQAQLELLRERQSLLRLQFQALRQRGIDARYVSQRNHPPVITYTYAEPTQEDQMSLLSVAPLRVGSEYRITSVVADPTTKQLTTAKGQLPAYIEERYVQIPDTVPDRVRRLALDITRGAKTTSEKADAIESYLRTMNYREDMPATPPSRDFVDYFLFDLKEGYCTYYASAMAVMLRSLDIPARVVTGFAPGKYNDQIGRYEISESQAHAWPQVYYPGLGWVNYEPTPIRQRVQRETPDRPATGPGAPNSIDPSRRAVEDRFGSRQAGAQAQVEQGGVPLPIRALATVLGALVLAAALIYVASLVRLRGLSGATRQYAKLTQVGTAIGVAPRVSQTPNEYGGRLGAQLHRAGSSVRHITSEYVAEVFGGRKADERRLSEDWRNVLREAARSIPTRSREGLRALWNSDLLRRYSRR